MNIVGAHVIPATHVGRFMATNDWKLAKYGDEKESPGNAVAIDESKMIESIPFSKEEIEALEKMS